MSASGCNPTFKERRPFNLRSQDVVNIRKIHPSKVPVIVERYEAERQLPLLARCKFLVPEQITVAELMQIIRRRLQLHPDQALFLLVNEKSLVSNSLTMSQVYSDERDVDGYLYIVYTSHPAFGAVFEYGLT